MKFKDFFDIDILFHPNMFYDSDWFLNGDQTLSNQKKEYLRLNSKNQNGRNLYNEYLEKYYYKPFNNILNSKKLAYSFDPQIVLTVSDDGQKRMTQFCFITYLMQLIAFLNLVDNAFERFVEEIGEDIIKENQLLKAKELVRLESRYYHDILNKGKNSEYYNKALDIYHLYSTHYKWDLSFEDFVDRQIYTLQRLLVGSRYYLETFNKELNLAELLNCFDYDTFCLLAAVSALDACNTTEKLHNQVDYAASYLKSYVDAVKKYRNAHHHYNCSIITGIDNKHKKIIVDIDYVIQKFESLLSRHPEFSFVEIDTNKLSSLMKHYGDSSTGISDLDLTSRSGFDVLDPVIKKFIHEKELAASWEFIPRTAKKSSSERSTTTNTSRDYLSVDEYVRRMIIGKDFLENSAYIYKMYGLNKFEGYIGYVYSTGVVIFEKYYENIKTKRIAKESATYAMSIYNFLELSKLNRMDIVRKLKEDHLTDVKRIFHGSDMSRWESEVTQAISGIDYTEEVVSYIDTLLNDNVLTRDTKKVVKK